MKITVIRRKSALRFCVLVLLLFCAAITMAKPQRTEAQLMQQAGPKPGPAIGRAAIAFNLQSLDGKAITLETFRGRPLVLNFFASWCDPCREEMPLINEFASTANKDGYSVLGIAIEDTRAAVTDYARESKLAFPIALDLNSSVKRSYRIFGPPATFFIDGQGVVRDIVLGPMTRERAREGLKNSGISR
jgi:cytochrome c biogenesis protein CcmG/thiol:disulfide interchange protein DsbE